MAYKVKLKSGEMITLADAVREVRDGSGVRFFDVTGAGCGSFADGQVDYSYPADSAVTAPAADPDAEVSQ